MLQHQQQLEQTKTDSHTSISNSLSYGLFPSTTSSQKFTQVRFLPWEHESSKITSWCVCCAHLASWILLVYSYCSSTGVVAFSTAASTKLEDQYECKQHQHSHVILSQTSWERKLPLQGALSCRYEAAIASGGY